MGTETTRCGKCGKIYQRTIYWFRASAAPGTDGFEDDCRECSGGKCGEAGGEPDVDRPALAMGGEHEKEEESMAGKSEGKTCRSCGEVKESVKYGWCQECRDARDSKDTNASEAGPRGGKPRAKRSASSGAVKGKGGRPKKAAGIWAAVAEKAEKVQRLKDIAVAAQDDAEQAEHEFKELLDKAVDD